MAKESKRKTAPAESKRERADEGTSRAASAGSFLKAVVVLTFVGTAAWGYLRTRGHVEKHVAFGRMPPNVVLKDRPLWMSQGLAQKIVRVAAPEVAHSAFDHSLLVNTAQMLASHPDTAPWIRKVKAIRRGYDKAPGDLIEIDCEFRAPVAAVKWMDYYWYIDGDGVLLPEQFNAAEVRRVLYDGSNRLNIRIIEGVASAPPESGQKWVGADLVAGIDMVKLLHGRACADEIERVNVANFAGRVDKNEAQVTLITRYQTQVRWGRPVNAQDDYFVEVTPDQKLQYMQSIVQQFGRVDANHSAVDLRFDWVTYPSGEAPTRSASNQ